MATVPLKDFGGARGEMNRMFAEMPGARAALVLVILAATAHVEQQARNGPAR